jgi:hypothetical protein
VTETPIASGSVGTRLGDGDGFMNGYLDSSERKPSDFFFFALGFFGFLVAAAGIVLTSAAFALIGATILLLAICSFGN